MRRALLDISGVFVAIFGLLILQAEKAQADSLSPSGVISQKNIGDCACGPCAIFNSFQFGDASLNNLASALSGDAPADKVRSLITRYGARPSVVNHNEPRYLAHGGMWEDDLVPFINDWLRTAGDAPVKGEHLQGNETGREYLRHVYTELDHSLAAGFPPVINLQAYTAHKNFFHHYWKWLDGHFVTVLSVQDTLSPDASQFSMSVADSESGRILKVTVYAPSSSTPAHSQIQRSGKIPAQIARDYPYLTIQSSRLEKILAGSTAKSPSTICVLQYLVHR